MRIGFAESIHNEVDDNLDYQATTVLLMEGMDRVAKVNPDKIWRKIYTYALLFVTAISLLTLWHFIRSKHGQT